MSQHCVIVNNHHLHHHHHHHLQQQQQQQQQQRYLLDAAPVDIAIQIWCYSNVNAKMPKMMNLMEMDKLLRYAFVSFVLFCVLMDRSVCIKAAAIEAAATPAENVTTITNVTRMYDNLRQVPVGADSVTHLNLGYNHLAQLENLTFRIHHFANVRKMYLFRNRIAVVQAAAFRGLRRLETLDLSDNNLTTLAVNTFADNDHLKELVLANNQIRFERQRTFVRSHSLQTLILSNNRITEVDDATFVGLVNLKRLMLTDNKDLVHLSPMCFKSLRKLKYLSLTNTGVHRIHIDMFFVLPRIVNLHGTPFAQNFQPPLTQLTSESFAELAIFDQLID